jgi:hypothetical protein
MLKLELNGIETVLHSFLGGRDEGMCAFVRAFSTDVRILNVGGRNVARFSW